MHNFSSPTLFVYSLLAFACPVYADFIPIALNQDSFDQDVVVERTATPPITPVTTASMDSGVLNDGFSWYERGYHEIWITTGLPAAGSVLTSDADWNHFFKFAPSYHSNNAVLIDSTVTNGTLKMITPIACAGLSFLVSAGISSGVVGYTVNFQDGTSESGSLPCPYWIGGAGAAWSANGRADVVNFTFDSMLSDNPKLFARDISLAKTQTPITSIDFRYESGVGHNAIFAVSGTIDLSQPFTPLEVTGCNHDLVVEADALRAAFMQAYTTATMERGIENSRRTWFEQGYYPLAPACGLPPAGSLVRSEAAPDHSFQLHPSYESANAVLLDAVSSTAILTLATPTNFAALSFLTAAAYGPVTNLYVINHADGTAETNKFISPDWLEPAPAVLSANGRINISSKIVDKLSSGFPRLFAVDVPVANSTNPITKVSLRFAGGGIDARSVIFALSGSSRTNPPVTPPVLSVLTGPDGSLVITSTAAGRLQSSTHLDGANTVWQDEGAIDTTRTVTPSLSEVVRYYRVVVPAGLATVEVPH